MRLTLDHVILRAADPAATLAELADRAGAPVLAHVEEVGGLASGIVRAGAIDLEVLRIGAEPPPHPLGYGLGFSADVPLAEAVADLRERGFPCSPPARAAADGRKWSAVQVHGLLPDPFPVPASTKRRAAFEAVGAALARIPAVSKAATRKAGSSMVVVTDYEFDADAWRAKAGAGPDVIAVEVGTGGRDWSRFPLEPGPLQLHHSGPPGIRRIVFEGDAEAFRLGDVAFEFSSAA
jgi:hypothetical protein